MRGKIFIFLGIVVLAGLLRFFSLVFYPSGFFSGEATIGYTVSQHLRL